MTVGIAVAALHTPEEVLRSDHVRARESFVRTEIDEGIVGELPNGFVEFDGKRAGFRPPGTTPLVNTPPRCWRGGSVATSRTSLKRQPVVPSTAFGSSTSV